MNMGSAVSRVVTLCYAYAKKRRNRAGATRGHRLSALITVSESMRRSVGERARCRCGQERRGSGGGAGGRRGERNVGRGAARQRLHEAGTRLRTVRVYVLPAARQAAGAGLSAQSLPQPHARLLRLLRVHLTRAVNANRKQY